MKKIYTIPKIRKIEVQTERFITAASSCYVYDMNDMVTGGIENWPPEMGTDE